MRDREAGWASRGGRYLVAAGRLGRRG